MFSEWMIGKSSVNWVRYIFIGFLVAFSTSCGGGTGELLEKEIGPTAASATMHVSTPTVAVVSGQEEEQTTPPSNAAVYFGYTYHRSDGNRFVSGSGNLPDIQPIDIPLDGIPAWLVAGPFGDGSVWVVVLDVGLVRAFSIEDGVVESQTIHPNQLPPGMPPLLKITNSELSLIEASSPDAVVFTHPIPLDQNGDIHTFIDKGGNLVASYMGEPTQLSVGALPDARILTDGTGRLVTLTDGTTRYTHGVLGDDIEAGGMVLAALDERLQVITKIVVEEPAVVEGLSPIWADFDGNGYREIIVTQSDAQNGSQIVVYDEYGALQAAGSPIGRGFRWRHQLAVAGFGPAGELELAVVRTPHIGGVVEFYQLIGDKLEIVAQIPGFSTHTIGSRNLDNAIAGDFDGDGRIELLVPDQAHRNLGAIQRSSSGAEVAWSLPLDGEYSTNLAAVTFSDGTIGVGVGTANNILQLWVP